MQTMVPKGKGAKVKLSGRDLRQAADCFANPSSHSTCYSGLRPLPQAREYKRCAIP